MDLSNIEGSFHRAVQSDFNGGFLACSQKVLGLIQEHGSITTELFEEFLIDEYQEIYQAILELQRFSDVEWSYLEDPRDGDCLLYTSPSPRD